MQRAAILPSAASVALPYFSTFSHKRQDILKKATEQKMYILISVQFLPEKLLILRRIQRDIVINVKTPLFKVFVILILIKLEFFRQIFEKGTNIKFYQNSYSGSRVVPCGITDGRIDMSKLIVAFCNSANVPNKMSVFC
jgi:hypothetical protein